MEEEKFQVEIVIDDSMSVKLDMKKKMNALEFLGMMTKTKKLFNLSNDIPTIGTSTNITGRRTNIRWSDVQEKIIRDNFNSKSAEEIEKMINIPEITAQKIKVKAYLMGLRKGNSSRSAFTPEETNMLIKMRKEGINNTEIARKLGVTYRKVIDKISYLKKRGELN